MASPWGSALKNHRDRYRFYASFRQIAAIMTDRQCYHACERSSNMHYHTTGSAVSPIPMSFAASSQYALHICASICSGNCARHVSTLARFFTRSALGNHAATTKARTTTKAHTADCHAFNSIDETTQCTPSTALLLALCHVSSLLTHI
jgi:hypothetical protein